MKKILIVDDEVDVLMVLEKRLTAVGFEVIKSSDGNTAVQMAQQHHPDLIIMDVNMPIMDGYEFLGNLRRMPGGDQPKVVFCTTENDVAHIARALHAGANEYIMKPFDKDIVTAKFQEVGLI